MGDRAIHAEPDAAPVDKSARAPAHPPAAEARDFVALLKSHQRAIGNRAIAGLLRRALDVPQGTEDGGSSSDGTATVTAGIADGSEPAGEAPAAGLPPPTERRMIRRGSRGPEVEYAQRRLNDHIGAGLDVDGKFGPLTEGATHDYQGTHALVVDRIIGKHTWASLDGPLTLGGGKGGPAGGVGSTVLLYDTDSQTFSPPTDTLAQIKQQIQDKQKNGDLGKTVATPNGTPGSEEERFVLNAILQRSNKSHWGTELHAIMQIGPVPAVPQGAPPGTNPGPAPVGLVTIQIDGAGNATGLLVSKTPLAKPSAFADIAAATAALNTFGFKAVTNDTATWTLDELNKVNAAVALLPAADRPALAGIELVRVSTATDGSGNPVAGLFATDQRVSGTTVTSARQLQIADSAFSTDATSFVGGASVKSPASFQTILHEAGHAVEAKAFLDAELAQFNATATFNKANDDTNKAAQAIGPADTTAVGQLNAFLQDKTKPNADRAAGLAYGRKVHAVTTALNAMFTETSRQTPAPSETNASAAIAARTAAAAKIAGNPAIGLLAQESSIQDGWFKQAVARAASFVAMKDAEDATKATQGAGGGPIAAKKITKRLKAFVDVVNTNKIPPLTAYAKKNWPAHPEEFFAEAYSLWLADPDYLGSQAPLLKAFFDSGGHRL